MSKQKGARRQTPATQDRVKITANVHKTRLLKLRKKVNVIAVKEKNVILLHYAAIKHNTTEVKWNT